MSTTPKFALTRLSEGQASAEITYNGDLNLIDSLMHCAIEDRDLATPPGSPTEGAAYIVAGSPTGDWTDHAGELAIYFSGWYFVVPFEGLTVRIKDENINIQYDGAAWVSTTSGLATTAYVDNAIAGLKWKQPVRVATTATGTLATAYENGDTVDGVVLATGDRILLKNQSSATENGIYVVAASGAPARATDADSGTELVSAAVWVNEGTANADKGFVCTNNSITIGATSIAFVNFIVSNGALLAANNLSDVANAATALSNLSGQPLDAELTAIAGLTSAADKVPYFTGSGTAALADLSSAGRALIDDADAAAQRTTLSLVPGTNVQAYSAQLASAAAIGDGIVAHTASNTFTPRTITGTANKVTVTNGDGVGGNPTINLVAGATYQASPADPTGTTDVTGKMMGLAGSITPAKSGTILISITAFLKASTTPSTPCTMRAYYGTGAAPANGDAITGNAIGNIAKVSGNSALVAASVTCHAIVSGLSVGTAYWLDLMLNTAAGTVTAQNISISVIEL